VLGSEDGVLRVYEYPARFVLRYDTGHGCALRCIAFGRRDPRYIS